MAKNDEILSFSDKCGIFLTNNRKTITGIFIAVCTAIIIALTAVSFTARKAQAQSEKTDSLIAEWLELQTKKDDGLTEKEDALIVQLEAQAEENGHTYAGFRAYATLGEIYVLRELWDKALPVYQKAAECLPHNYTAGVAYFNAASCADELGDYEKALQFYSAAAECEDFPLKPRALFNTGRLHEILSHTEEAIALYTKLAESYPDNSWTMLGKSRILALSVK